MLKELVEYCSVISSLPVTIFRQLLAKINANSRAVSSIVVDEI
jgi:hypothetical protein